MKSVYSPTLAAITSCALVAVSYAGFRVWSVRMTGVISQGLDPLLPQFAAMALNGSKPTGRSCGIFRNGGHVIISDRLIGSANPAGR